MPPTKSVPFRSVLSFEYLLEFWRTLRVTGCQTGVCELVDRVEALAKERPFLGRPIEDPAVLADQRDALDLFFSVVFPPASWDRDYAAVFPPFSYLTVYATPSFAALEPQLMAAKQKGGAGDDAYFLLVAYRYVLADLYGIQMRPPDPHVYEVEGEDGFPRCFVVEMDRTFTRVVAGDGKAQLPKLADADVAAVWDGTIKPERLLALLPPENFEFRGLLLLRATEITQQALLSKLRQTLLDMENLEDCRRFHVVEQLVGGLVRKPGVHFHIAAFVGEEVLLFTGEEHQDEVCLVPGSLRLPRGAFEGTVFQQVADAGKPYKIEDVLALPAGSREREALGDRARSCLLLPLGQPGDSVGLAVLVAPEPDVFDLGDALALRETLPLLALAVRRTVEDLERRVQAVVQEKCTAVHPTVAWRFRRAATRYLAGERGVDGDLEPIVFDDVWPLYAVSDIRASSTHRNAAILADLADQLALACRVLDAARAGRPLPAFEELRYRLGKMDGLLKDGLDTGDEIAILQFLRQEVEPYFDVLAEAGEATRAAIADYRAGLDERHGAVYRRRRDFDESVAAINQALAAVIDAAQPEAQAVFPHYFDKTSTDGVDQSLYVGPALVEDRAFSPLYVRNLRLWQLVTLARAARVAHELVPSLAVPLETTHLVVVQDLPITIRFRTDEKRFAVDGAYNIRYEIMKKRMDKAVVRGTGERLTQPRRIAVVVSQEQEAREYRRYLEYLHAARLLLDDVEEMELEDLQGIHGLKALRVGVDLSTPAASVAGFPDVATLR